MIFSNYFVYLLLFISFKKVFILLRMNKNKIIMISNFFELRRWYWQCLISILIISEQMSEGPLTLSLLNTAFWKHLMHIFYRYRFLTFSITFFILSFIDMIISIVLLRLVNLFFPEIFHSVLEILNFFSQLILFIRSN